MEHYEEFCQFINQALVGLNVQVSGNACNVGFASMGDQIAVTLVYSSSINVISDGEIPSPSTDIADVLRLRTSLASRVDSQIFKLEALDCIQFKNSAVGTGSRWQLRFRRY